MNKLFTKIAALSVGLAMVAGVGVAVGGHKNVEVAKADETEFCSWSRSGTTDTYTTGFTFSATASAKTGFYQDGTDTTGLKLYSSSVPLCAVTPVSVTLTASIGAGSANLDFDNYVYACYVNSSGTTISSSEVAITNHVTTKEGDSYEIAMPVESATSAYGVYLYHTKESSKNIRYFSFSLSYEASSATVYDVVDDVDNGSLDVSLIAEGDNLVATITPDLGYAVPESVTVTMVGNDSPTYSYDNGVVTVENVTGDVTISGSCVEVVMYEVSDRIDNGSLSVSAIAQGATLTVTIIPDTDYLLPESLTFVRMAGVDAEYDYNSSTGVVTVVNVQGNIAIEGACIAEFEHAGTAEDPYTVSEGILRAQKNGTTASGDYYVRGIISSITSTLSDVTGYGNATFNISDDGRNEDYLIAYQVKYIGGEAFTEETFALLETGLIAVVHGPLYNYKGTTPEFAGKSASSLYSLEEQETGDVDVTFTEPGTVEVGDTGTFVATSETAGVVFSWSSDNESVLSVNASTGAYEAHALGTARITVTATANEKEGTTYRDIIVNGSISSSSIAEANAIAASLESGKTTDYYVYVSGYVKAFATSYTSGDNPQPRALDIWSEDELDSIMIYTNTTLYPEFIDGLNVGDSIIVKGNIQNFNGTYEVTNPIRVSADYSQVSFAEQLIVSTNNTCEEYEAGTKEYDEHLATLTEVWSTLKSIFNDGSKLSEPEKNKLVDAEAKISGTTVERAMARYDRLVAKYGLENFISERDVDGSAYVPTSVATNNSTDMLIIVAAFGVSTLFFVTLCVVRKRKGMNK